MVARLAGHNNIRARGDGKLAKVTEGAAEDCDGTASVVCFAPHTWVTAKGRGGTGGEVAQADRLPGMVSIYVDGMDSEELIIKLDAAGFEVSAGSACSSGSMDPSHVLSAMGIGREQALGALRISFDDRVNPADLDEFAQTLLSIVGAA